MQIINDPSVAGSLAKSLGTGIHQLGELKLAQLTKKYEQEQERSQFAKQWEPILGRSTANFLSNLNPEERRNAIGDLENLTGAFQQPDQDSGLGALAQQNRQQFGQPQQPDQQQQILQAIKQHFGQPYTNPQQQFGQEQPQQEMPGQQKSQNKGAQLTPEGAKLLRSAYESPKEKAERKKLEFQDKQINLKETKKYIDTLKDQEKAAKESDLRLKRMSNLIGQGKLPNAGLWSFLTKIEDLGPLATGGAGAALGSIIPGIGTAVGAVVGGVVGGLSGPLAGAAKSYIKSGSPDIEEFEKLSADFVKNAKQYFGGRLTDADLRGFMQTVPTLMQTDAGKKKVIANLSSLNNLAQIEAKAARSIIKANGGVPPLDIEQQVKDKISDKIDKVAEKFISG